MYEAERPETVQLCIPDKKIQSYFSVRYVLSYF